MISRDATWVRTSLLLFLLAVPSIVLAQSDVTIRAETHIRLKAKKTPDGTTVYVELRDNIEQNLDGEAVTLRLEPLTGNGGVVEKTNYISRGRAEFSLEGLRFATYRATAIFAGSTQYAPSRSEIQIDISKDTPSLSIESPAEVPLDSKEAVLIARLSIWEKPLPRATVTLRGLKGEPKSQRTDEAGEAIFTFSPQDLSAQGPNPLVIRFEGDDLHNPTETQRIVSLVLPVSVSLKGPSELAADEELYLEGSLSTSRGSLANKSVAFFVQIARGEERPLGSTTTDSDGEFEASLAGKVFKSGKELRIVARFTPDAPWLRPGESAPLTVLVRPPQPVPAAFYLVPLFVCGAIALGMFLVRSTRRREIKPQSPPKPKTGLVMTGRASLGAEEATFGGKILDAKTKEILAEAEISLQYEGAGSFSAKTDEEGRFLLEGLPKGRPLVRVSAQGFVSEELRVELPHRGKYRDVTIALLPVRERVLEIFREVAVQVLPEAGLWGTWTPREIRRYAREKKYHVKGPIGELVLLFESVYFAGVIGDAQTIQQANALSQEALGALNPVPLKPAPAA